MPIFCRTIVVNGCGEVEGVVCAINGKLATYEYFIIYFFWLFIFPLYSMNDDKKRKRKASYGRFQRDWISLAIGLATCKCSVRAQTHNNVALPKVRAKCNMSSNHSGFKTNPVRWAKSSFTISVSRWMSLRVTWIAVDSSRLFLSCAHSLQMTRVSQTIPNISNMLFPLLSCFHFLAQSSSDAVVVSIWEPFLRSACSPKSSAIMSTRNKPASSGDGMTYLRLQGVISKSFMSGLGSTKSRCWMSWEEHSTRFGVMLQPHISQLLPFQHSSTLTTSRTSLKNVPIASGQMLFPEIVAW